jgi:hypothetical protein
MDERFGTGRFVKRIDVLRHDRYAAMLGFEPRKSQVRRVRMDARMCAPPRIIEIENARGVALEAIRRGDIAPIVLRPDSIRIAESRNTAFGG